MGLIIKNGFVVTEKGIITADILIENEKISKIDKNIKENLNDEVIDVTGKLVMPGVIDAHVHYYMKTESGRTADNFETGSLSAAFGGVTTIIDYVSPIIGKKLIEALLEREKEAQGHCYVDYNFHVEITGKYDWNLDELYNIKDYGIQSLKIYTTYENSKLPYDKIPNLLKKAKELDMLVTVHAEDDEILRLTKDKFLKEGRTKISDYADSRPREAEEVAIDKVIKIAEGLNTPVYFVHVSTAEGAKAIKKSKENGYKVYGETCPHYLILTDECYKKIDGQKYIMAPPLRKKEDQDVLWDSILNGTLSCITTDHCAFNIKDKLSAKDCFNIIPGIGGSETLLSLIFTEGVNKGKITLEKMVQLLCTNPAKMFGLYPKKGVIAPGSDGDIVIFDLEKEVVLNGKELHSASEYTVFDGFKLKGYPVVTILRGKVICKDNNLIDIKPCGKFVKAKK